MTKNFKIFLATTGLIVCAMGLGSIIVLKNASTGSMITYLIGAVILSIVFQKIFSRITN